MRSPESSGGVGAIQMPPRIFNPPMCSSTPCADGSRLGRESASIFSTCRKVYVRYRNRWILTMHRRAGMPELMKNRSAPPLLPDLARVELRAYTRRRQRCPGCDHGTDDACS